MNIIIVNIANTWFTWLLFAAFVLHSLLQEALRYDSAGDSRGVLLVKC